MLHNLETRPLCLDIRVCCRSNMPLFPVPDFSLKNTQDAVPVFFENISKAVSLPSRRWRKLSGFHLDQHCLLGQNLGTLFNTIVIVHLLMGCIYTRVLALLWHNMWHYFKAGKKKYLQMLVKYDNLWLFTISFLLYSFYLVNFVFVEHWTQSRTGEFKTWTEGETGAACQSFVSAGDFVFVKQLKQILKGPWQSLRHVHISFIFELPNFVIDFLMIEPETIFLTTFISEMFVIVLTLLKTIAIAS